MIIRFVDGDQNIQDLHKLQLAMMPHAMAWMGKDDIGRSLLYRFVQSAPFLFELNGRTTANAVGGKSKMSV